MEVTEQLRAEQDHLDRTYARIESLRRTAEAHAASAARLVSAAPSEIPDREALLSAQGGRQNHFNIGDQSICFGRLDTLDNEIFHVGRLAVSDAEGDPMLVDWRAPIAEAFYRATAGDPRGMARRRHIRMRARTVVAIDDEPLDRESLHEDDALVGEAALLAALAAPRRGQMGDIVATIQAQQDEAIRAPLRGVLVVQGGPGTGKTAVALHRAAYLLYAHQLELSVAGVLVVGPNAIFSRYVANVLPGLGETGVRIATPSDLVTDVAVGAIDEPAVAKTKGSAAMVDELRATLASHIIPLPDTVHVGFDRWRLAVTPADSAAFIAAGTAEDKPYAEGRVAAYRALLTHLTEQAEIAADASTRAGQLSRHHFDATAVRRRLADDASVRRLTSRFWPRLTPDEVVDETLGRLGLPADPQQRSVHDIALLDEANVLVGTPPAPKQRATRNSRVDDVLDRVLAEMGLVPSCKVCGSELDFKGVDWKCTKCDPPKTWRSDEVLSIWDVQRLNETIARVNATYAVEEAPEERTTWGHVLVDEAQELTPMQWRMLARRCPSGSFTIVGDLNQRGGASDATSWVEVGQLASPTRQAQVLTLDVNYRTPEEIMTIAAEVLRASDVTVEPPRSVRASGELPTAIRAADFASARQRALELAQQEAAATEAGTVAVIVPDDGAPVIKPEALDDRWVELGVEQARGLEFDSVIVVEPARFELHALYVALTRATTRLTVVYSEPLPSGLEKLKVGS